MISVVRFTVYDGHEADAACPAAAEAWRVNAGTLESFE